MWCLLVFYLKGCEVGVWGCVGFLGFEGELCGYVV